MKIIKKLMQIALSAFFFGLLATSAVLADDASSEGWKFVQENGRTYYRKGELKETYWRVIDGKYYYFDPLSGEMVVGWQYIPAPHEGVTIGSSLRQDIAFRPDWFYFGQDGPIVDYILDAAGNKGTGKWTSQSSLDLGVPLSLITESVFARYISTYKEERVHASKVLPKPADFKFEGDKAELIEKIRQALYFSKIISYAQGFAQLRVASKENNWNLPFADIASIWRDGCIIRSRFLQKITDAYNRDADLANLLLDEYFLDVTAKYQQSVRDIVALAVQAGVPVPTFSAAITYFDSYRSADLPANLIQAQRDYFGAHTYQRKDKEGTFHYSWYDEK